jgi:ribA/ribD-fused uncharacterized protein
MNNVINSFAGKYRFLSNFYECTVSYAQENYPSVEHAYQAAKTLDLEYRAMIKKALTPAKAKQLGRVVPIRDNWELIKIPIMRGLVKQKFKNPELLHRLQATTPAILIEGNWWGDKFWGVHIDGEGENWLGKILMEIRDVQSTI